MAISIMFNLRLIVSGLYMENVSFWRKSPANPNYYLFNFVFYTQIFWVVHFVASFTLLHWNLISNRKVNDYGPNTM